MWNILLGTLMFLFVFYSFPPISVFGEIVEQRYEKANRLYRRDIKPIFQRKCFDCHSSHTNYPWFYYIPFLQQEIDRHINEGKEVLMYDQDFPFTSNQDQVSLLNSIQAVIDDDSMPPKLYRLFNHYIELTDEERELISKWIDETRTDLLNLEYTDIKLSNEPIQSIYQPSFNEDIVSLGDKLFHEPRLSSNNSIACSTCHVLDFGGVDRKEISIGINGELGHANAPTVFNSAFNIKQFWDGRADTLEEQIDGPLQSSFEMGSSWDEVIDKLEDVPEYVSLFEKSFKDGITVNNIKKSLADFQRSLITPSRFDDFLLGKNDAITAQEKEGYDLFKRYGCISCHQGVNVGGNLFEKIGKFHDYFSDRGKPIKEVDYGRFNVTKQERDKFRFKVPTLRNIELTYPYFHDGSVNSLNDAVSIMAKHQLGRQLSQREVELLVSFLKTLTGKQFVSEN